MKKTLATVLFACLSQVIFAQSIKMAQPPTAHTANTIYSKNIGAVDENTFKEANTEGVTSPRTLYLIDGKIIDEKTILNLSAEKIAKLDVIKNKKVIEKDFPKYKQYDVIIRLTSKKS